MGDTITMAQVLRFTLTTLALFALLFLAVELTPWLAKHVDNWVARYRREHDSRRDPTYGVRSIYELPPEKTDEKAAEDKSPEDAPPAP